MRTKRSCVWLVLLLVLAACAPAPRDPADDESGEPLVVYSGRNERLVGPLLERFGREMGVDVQVRYGSTSEMAATLMEEGPHTPASVFISQDAAALGALSGGGLLIVLPEDLTRLVPERFRSARGDWVGLSGRARTVVYNTSLVSVEELPQTLGEITDPRYRGRFGIAPGNASFQAHMACFLALNGEKAAREQFAGMARNEPLRYAKNSPIVAAVISGEIDWGLVNHYYLWRALKENPDAPAKNFFMRGEDGSSFINIAGVGLLRDDPQALELIEFLLGDEAQRYFATETYEYPLVHGVAPTVELPELASLDTAQIDYTRLAEALEPALELIESSGLNRF